VSKRKRREEKWDYASLEWIHRVRAKIYEAEKGRPLTELTPRLSQRAAAVARRLNLRVIRGAELPMRRRRTG
jgi:hypothetical protein